MPRLRLAPLAPTAVLVAAHAAAQPPARRDSAARVPAIVVTATRDSLDALASPLPTATLGAAQLRRDHGVSLAQTIRRLPGVRALTTGEQIGKPVIRGLSGARVLVLDDGMRLEDYSWSDEDGPSIEARLADRVEVIRGPASVLYGSDALGGVVNAISAPLLDARGGPGMRRGEVELYGASNNGEGGGALRLDLARGRVAGRLVGVARLGQNVHTPGGEIENTGFGAFNGEGVFGVRHASGAQSTVRLAHYGGEYKLLEIDGPPAGSGEAEDEGPERVALDDRLQLSHERRAGGLRLEARGQLQRHALAEKSDLPNPAPGQPKEATVFDLVLNTATVDLLAHHGGASGTGASGAAWTGTIGVSGLAQHNDSRGIIPLVPDATIVSGAVFAFEQLAVGRVSLLAGARADGRHLDASADPRLALADQTRTYSAVTGDLGAVFRPTPETSLAVNAGRAWRAPTLFELFANGPRLGEGRYELGNASLDPERSFNLDASVRWTTPRVRAEVAAFRNRVQDFVFIAPTPTVQDGLRVYQYSRADATLTGAEASAEVTVAAPLDVHARIDGVRGTNTTTDDPLPLIPPVRAAVGAELRGAHRTYVSAEVEHVAEQTRLSAAERSTTPATGRFSLATDAYTLLDLGAGLTTALHGRDTHVDLRVRNATNARYRDFLSRYKEFAYDPGVNVVLRVRTEF